MESVMAAYVGYSVLSAGKPNTFRAIVGSIFTEVLVNGMTILNVPVQALDIFKGIVLVLAVSLHALQRKTQEKI